MYLKFMSKTVVKVRYSMGALDRTKVQNTFYYYEPDSRFGAVR